jgi:indolepyruvate ferredoxin oxidoreductase
VARVVVVTDEVDGYHERHGLSRDVVVKDRDELLPVEEELARTAGVTALIYDQTCAAEKRRRRKRGRYPDPQKRYFINSAVCEGCGDCGKQSSCVSLAPVEKMFGTKRRIDQSSCNKDYSCVDGFCPSFVSVIGGKPRSQAATPAVEGPAAGVPLADPPMPDAACSNILVAGIGGTGVVTIGAIIGTAAHLSDKSCSLLDLTGLSQKNGAVLSHVRLADSDDRLPAARIGVGEADALIGCDLLVAASPEAVKTYHPATSVALNTKLVAVAAFQQNRSLELGGERALDIVGSATDPDARVGFDATREAEAHFGDAIFSNMIMLGVVYQMGRLPLKSAAIEAAIRLNGVAVEKNLAAFRRGRAVAAASLGADAPDGDASRVDRPVDTLEAATDRYAAWLEVYQDRRYAQAYLDIVGDVRRCEQRVRPGSTVLTDVVARNLARLMAYKDEYEVARLFSTDDFARELAEQFEGDFTIRYNLSPPLLARKDPHSGRPAKYEFGGWVRPLLALLAKARRLRGSRLDVFGMTEERRVERALIVEYRAAIDLIKARLDAGNLDEAVQALALADEVRGYGPVKLQAIDRYRPAFKAAVARFADPAGSGPRPD